jgi:tetratricopeptide (TPR) repeat protein
LNDRGVLWHVNRRDAWIAVCLLLLILAVYAPVRHFDYVNFDDPTYVTRNRHVTGGLTGDDLHWAFTGTAGANWFPLTWISMMADIQFFGMGAGPQHTTNVLIHAASALLLFWLLKRLTGESFPSAAVAFLFAVHPQHVESVAWVTERKDVLSALFWMLALLAYARYASHRGTGSYLLTLLFYCLGLLSKPMVITLPLILILLDIWPLRRIEAESLRAIFSRRNARTLIWEKLPFFAVAMVMSAVTYLVQTQAGAVRSLDALPLSLRLENAVNSGAVYIAKTLWPSRLAVFYPMHAGPPAWHVMVSGLVLVGLTVLALLTLGTRPYLAVGWFWYLITLLPVIGILQVGEQARADRYSYIPGIGLAIMLAWSAADASRRWPKSRPAWIAVCCAAGIALTVLTSKQLSYWENSTTLFRHANQVTEDNYIAHGCLGEALRAQGRFDEALAEYRTAIAINPQYVAALINYGAVLGLVGRTGEAIAPLRTAVRLQHDDVDAHNGLGLALALEGHLNEALEQFEIAVLLDPGSVEAHMSLGRTLGNLGRLDRAISEFSAVLRLQPDSVEARTNLQKATELRDRAVKK